MLIVSNVVIYKTITAGGAFDETFSFTATATGIRFQNTSAGTTDIDWPNTTIKQTDIAASSDFSTPGDNPMDGRNTAAAVGQAAGGNLGYGYTFDGATSFVDNYSAALNSKLNPAAGTAIAFAKVSGGGVWTDGSFRRILTWRTDANNRALIFKANTNNRLEASFVAGGVFKTIANTSFSPTDYFMVAITWDTSGGGQFKLYLDGVQFGATQTGIGTWVGNLDSTRTNIGASITTPAEVWDGDIAHVGIANRVLSATEINDIWDRSGLS